MPKLGGIACCCPTCFTFSDDFNRADSDTVGTGWVETSGDWDIVSNKVSISATGTLTQNTAPTADGDGSGRPADFDVSVVVSSPTDNVVVKVGMHDILAVLDFAANTIGLGNKLADFILAASTSYTVRVIYKKPIACVLVDGACVLTTVPATPTAAAPTLQVTTNPTPSAVTFDDYALTVHNVDNPNCVQSCEDRGCVAPDCAGLCQTNTTPIAMQVVISGIVSAGGCSPDCENLNGTYILDQCVDFDGGTDFGALCFVENECSYALAPLNIEICQGFGTVNGLIATIITGTPGSQTGADVKCQFSQGPGVNLTWQDVDLGTSPIDCMLAGAVLPINNDTTDCDTTSSTATLTGINE